MKMSGGVEWALHCCVVLSRAGAPVPAAKLAELHDVSQSYLAKQLQLLSRAGLVRSTLGQSGGYVLTRATSEITVLDVVEAIDGAQPAFRCTEVRQRGPLAVPAERCDTPCPIARVMDSADRAWRESLRAITVADLVADVGRTTPAETLEAARQWLRA
ncbi:RrF2 family transcriptional regulator [Paractinoplanes lichenicola]|uniref:Rrf2 family transcriptional regulator n=1 Tax=Paractinoplanes lichenicola TaxID=2802976 RepID=A0ABS1VP52_9ACTN|nr:Rrf2 family transcriptional regulator [Actinoplanes lichenicola]MBL7255914.1 Rrf2 family transcriptional regulator [Actinoplanes lichenicola]